MSLRHLLAGENQDQGLLVALQPSYFASRLVMAEIDLRSVAELVGHST